MRHGSSTSALTYVLPTGSNLLAAAGKITRDAAWCIIFPFYTTGATGTGMIQLHNGSTNTIRIENSNGGADIRAQIFNAAGTSLATRTLASVPANELVYVCLSNSGGSGSSNVRLMLARQNGTTIDSGNANYSTDLNTSRSALVVGKQGLGALNSFIGFIGPIVFRQHACTPTELLALLNRRSPGELFTYDDGATFDSHDQVFFAFDGCGGTNPRTATGQTGTGTPGLPEEWSPDSSASATNVCIFDAGIDKFSNTVYPNALSVAGTLEHADIVTFAPGWFTEPNAPGSGGATVVFDAIPAIAPKAKMIFDDAPVGLVSYLGHGNSRLQGEYPTNIEIPGVMTGVLNSGYHAGLMLRRWASLAGQLAVSARLGTGSASLGADNRSTSQDFSVGTANANNASPWRRFGCGSAAAESVGPGQCVEIALNGYYQHATLSEVPGTLFTSSVDRVIVGRFLAFPGSASVTPEVRTGSAINSLGTSVSTGSALVLDTTISTTTVVSYTAGVGYNAETGVWDTSPPTAVLTGISLGGVVGGLVYFSSGGNEGLARIKTLSEGGGNTTVTFEHEPRASGVPAAGWTAKVGPWAWRKTVSVVPAGTAGTYIGARWNAGASGSVPRIYSHDKFAVGVDGFAIGGTGAGGWGGEEQLAEGHTSAGADGTDPFHAFLASHALPAAYGGRDGPDVMEFIDAEQGAVGTSDPAYRGVMTTRYRANAPIAGRKGGVAWWTPPVRGRNNGGVSTQPDWDPQTSFGVFAQYILDNAADFGVLGCSSYAALGLPSSSYVRKLMANSQAHFSAYFAYLAWESKLATGAQGWERAALPDDDTLAIDMAAGSRFRGGDRLRTR